MAEIVTGALVSIFLERIIDTLASRFVDIFRSRKHKKKQLSDLKTKLLAIDVVGFDAEQKQFTDPRVRDWLLRAKDVVCDAEDILKEIEYELCKSQVEAESQSATNKVWNSLKSSFVTFFENEIESRMEQVVEDLEELATQSDFLGLEKVSGVGVGSGSSSKLTRTSLLNEGVMYGRDEDREFVFNWLTSDTHKNLSILCIVGMGGLGKTSLAQHVFNDPRIDFDIKVWVTVSLEFDVLNVSRAILDTVTGSTDHSIEQEVVQRRLKEELTGKKFLLILDDVWNERQSKWEDVQKPLLFGGQGGRILVTTRSEKVAVTMRSEKHLLEVLRNDYCWDLFAKHAFQSVNPQPDPEFMEIGKKIVEKCNGLPLALKTMGSLLRNKSSFWEWESIMKSEIWDFSENESDMLPALRLSYLHLPSHLKKCFAFCALFPKGYEFDKECLIQLWMAENFLATPLQKRSPKEVGEQYFNDLLSWSFFEESGKEEEKHFIMHDLLNDLAKFVCEDICIRLGVDDPILKEHSSNHQGSSSTRSCQRGDNALVLQSQKSSWPEILSTFDRMVQNQLKHEVEEIKKCKKELEDANLKVAELEAKLSEMAQDRDDALGKLQRTIEDYARHRDEREAANQAWEYTENMLQDKISTLNTALETVKDETGRCFVEGFNGALEQFHVLYPHLDTSTFDPFKSVHQ